MKNVDGDRWRVEQVNRGGDSTKRRISMEIPFQILYILYIWSKLDNKRAIYLDNGMNERRDRDICVESLTFNVSRREKLFDSRTSFCRNVDCVDLEPVLRLFMTVLDLPNEREERREREREREDSQSAYHRIDISMFPHGHGASPPWSITTGPRLLDQGFVCSRTASSRVCLLSVSRTFILDPPLHPLYRSFQHSVRYTCRNILIPPIFSASSRIERRNNFPLLLSNFIPNFSFLAKMISDSLCSLSLSR